MEETSKQAEEGAVNTTGASDNQSGDEVDKDLQQLYEAVQKVQDERDQLKDQLLRTMADFQNFRRRQEEETRKLRETANANFVTALLPVLDSFERSAATVEKGTTLEALSDGVRAVERQLRAALESQRVTRIPSVGQPFDPDVHEALAMVETEDAEENTVVDEIEAGYRMGDRIIRPARVRVAKRP